MLTWYTSSMADQEATERAGEATAVEPVSDGEDTGQRTVRSSKETILMS